MGRAGMVGAFASVVLLARAGRADDTPAPLSSYVDAPGCPSAEAFSDRVEARTRLYRSDHVAVAVVLTLSAEMPGAGARGRVVVTHAGRVTERAIAGRDCDEVVEAL